MEVDRNQPKGRSFVLVPGIDSESFEKSDNYSNCNDQSCSIIVEIFETTEETWEKTIEISLDPFEFFRNPVSNSYFRHPARL